MKRAQWTSWDSFKQWGTIINMFYTSLPSHIWDEFDKAIKHISNKNRQLSKGRIHRNHKVPPRLTKSNKCELKYILKAVLPSFTWAQHNFLLFFSSKKIKWKMKKNNVSKIAKQPHYENQFSLEFHSRISITTNTFYWINTEFKTIHVFYLLQFVDLSLILRPPNLFCLFLIKQVHNKKKTLEMHQDCV